jgi:hypothetical protein
VLAGPDRSVALLARDVGRNLAIAHDLDENTQELNLTLEPAMTVIAQVKDVAGKPLTNGTAELVVWGGNSGSHLGEPFAADSEGRIEISALPPGRRFSLWLGAKGYGRISQNVPQDSDTNRVVLEPVSLKAIDRKISGRVVDADEQAAAGVRVSVQGENQPLTYGRTDEQGRFEFEVCEGSVRVYANSSRAGSYASGNATVQGGETNIVVKLGVNSSSASRRAVSRTSLQGKALPDLSGMGYKAPVPMNKPVLLCLLDIGQRPSRRAARVLADKWEKLRSANVHVLGLQAVPVAAETLKEWSASNTVPFEVGMVPPQAGAARWASQAPSLPWLLLTDANGRVKSEGFSLDDLEAKLNAANQ